MRTEEEMQLTLASLRDEFGVDVVPAIGLFGQDLADWLKEAEDELFQRLMAERKNAS